MEKRVVIVDVAHLAYKAAFGGMPALTATLEVDGQLITLNTTIPTFIIKQVFRWSNRGINPTVVCADSIGGNSSRKAYFTKAYNDEGVTAYKGGRTSENDKFYQSLDVALNLLYQSGIACCKVKGYEADDLIKASVDLAKKTYPDLKIDIITGDADLLPLVDDQVSVFLSSRRTTWAETEELEKRGYVQITPSNYQEYIESLSSYKNLYVPYNTILLSKLLKGDKSDNIAGYPKFDARKYKKLVYAMEEDNVDFSNLFVYDSPIMEVCYRDTKLPIPQELIPTVPKDNKVLRFDEPKKVKEITDVLSNYLDDDIVEHVRHVYNGINLNGAFTTVPDKYKRMPAKLTIKIKGFDRGILQKNVSALKINLPMG